MRFYNLQKFYLMKKLMPLERILAKNFQNSVKVNDFELKMLVASRLFEEGKLSSGQAAEVVGISKRAFVEILGKYNVSLFGYEYEELEDDLENA